MTTTDLPTLEAALKLADQDSPLPSLAGPALKVLRDHIARLQAGLNYVTVVNELPPLDEAGKLPPPFLLLGKYGLEYINTGRPAFDPATKDSATLTALIAELRAREAVGRAKCGTDVDRTDLNNAQWRQHLREELMDALLYSLAEERTALPSMADLAASGRIRPIQLAEEPAQRAEVVECGGCAPPVAASPVYGVDHGVDDKTVEMFGYHDTKGVLHIEDIVASEPNGPNIGHGHVRPRPDAVVAKCGGPMLCRVCWNEQEKRSRTRLLASLVDAPVVNCWCETCRPSTTLANMRMVLCPTCGNKRCPHANDHRNACTGSNAVGQPGSSWGHVQPAAPPAPEDC